MKSITVNNVCGYPNLTDNLQDFAKANKALLILGVNGLLTLEKAVLQSDRVKIVIEPLPMLIHARIPFIGYTKIGFKYVRGDMVLPAAAQLKVRVPVHFKRLPAGDFVNLMKSESKAKFLKTLEPDSEEWKRVKGMFSPLLPASQFDKTPKPKDKKDGNEDNPDRASEPRQGRKKK
ncbi:hypothetical protein D3C87_1520070 [compost metagenome]